MVKLNTENLKTKEPKKTIATTATPGTGTSPDPEPSGKPKRGRPPVYREPFKGGATEYVTWRQTNCLQCTKSEDAMQLDQTSSCDLEEAFAMSFAGVCIPGVTEDSRVALALLRRKGEGPQCKEFEEWRPTNF